jgi:hypothetical protein
MATDVMRALHKEEVVKALHGLYVETLTQVKDHRTLLGPLAAPLRLITDEILPHAESIMRDRPKFRDDALVVANKVADFVQLALLVDEAAWELQHTQSARKCVVAAWLAVAILNPPSLVMLARGPLAGDAFLAIVRAEAIPPASAQEFISRFFCQASKV